MIKNLLSTKHESDLFDIKLKYYEDEKKFSLIKDIASFANCRELDDKYIIFGVENKTFKIVGMDTELPDISEIQSLLNMYVEPNIEIELGNQIIDGKDVRYIKIKNNINKPYVIKKSYAKNGRIELREGEIYIRKNATNSIATRNDLIQIFSEKESFSLNVNQVNFLPNVILLSTELKNETNKSIDISKITIRIIYDNQEFSISRCYLYTNDVKMKNKLCIDKENKIIINPRSKRMEWLYFEVDDKLFEIAKNKEIKKYLNIKNNNFLDMDIDIEI